MFSRDAIGVQNDRTMGLQMISDYVKRPGLGLLGLVMVGCLSSKTPEKVTVRPRAVNVFELQESQPIAEIRYAGSVSAWKSQDVGLEVSGRVQQIIEPGLDVVGPEFDPATNNVVEDSGTLLARVNPTRYQVRLASAEASVKTARARLAAAEQEVTKVMPKQLLASAAAMELARQEFARVKTLLAQDAATQQALDRAQANLDTTQAEYQQLEAVAAVKDAERASYAAQVDEALEAVRQAKEDLDDTELRAPFQGQVSAVYETVGSVVQAGQPVLRVQMMDPIQVDVQVSAETDARLLYNDLVRVFPPGEETPVPAMVYEKATVADATTRTFLVTLLIRNAKLTEGLPSEFDPVRDLRTRSIAPLFSEAANDGPPFYSRESALMRDGDEYFVLRVKGVQKGHPESQIPTQLEVERVRVVPGDKRISLLSVVTLRELDDLGDLNPDADLLVSDFLSMDGARLDMPQVLARLDQMGHMHYIRERWRLRPGDVVQAELSPAPVPRGLYVPMDVIVREEPQSNQGSLYVVDGTDDNAVCRKVTVRLQEPTVGSQVRVEALQPESLSVGALVVASGAHYLTDGEPVRVVSSGEGK